MANHKKIGVFDSGIGGLTVIATMKRMLPHEELIYFGDSANAPYGNRPEDDIVALVKKIADYLEKQNISMALIACNTISALIERFKGDYSFPFISIIEPAAKTVADMKLDQVGLIATRATVNSGEYERLIKLHNPQARVYSIGSPELANLLEKGAGTEAIDDEIRVNMDVIMAQAPLKHVILGCTHYPIVRDRFEALYPGVTFINPAESQTIRSQQLLREMGIARKEGSGKLTVCTSGDPALYASVLERLDVQPADELKQVVL